MNILPSSVENPLYATLLEIDKKIDLEERRRKGPAAIHVDGPDSRANMKYARGPD